MKALKQTLVGLALCGYYGYFFSQIKSNKIEKVQQQVSRLEQEERALEEQRWEVIARNLAQKYVKDHPSEFLQQADAEDVTIHALLKSIQAEKEKTLLQIRDDLARISAGGDKYAAFYLPTVSGDENKKNAIISTLLDAYERLKEEREFEQEVQAEMLEYAHTRRRGVRTKERVSVAYKPTTMIMASFLHHLYYEFIS